APLASAKAVYTFRSKSNSDCSKANLDFSKFIFERSTLLRVANPLKIGMLNCNPKLCPLYKSNWSKNGGGLISPPCPSGILAYERSEERRVGKEVRYGYTG